MKCAAIVVVILALVALQGCECLRVGTSESHTALEMTGLVDGYVSVAALHRPNGSVFQFGVFSWSEQPGEVLSVNIWPVVGLGLGPFGGRVRLFMLEVATGFLWYHPRPSHGPARETRPEGEGKMQEA